MYTHVYMYTYTHTSDSDRYILISFSPNYPTHGVGGNYGHRRISN